MFVIKALLLALETVTSLLLVFIILVQRTKGGGLGMAFGAGMGEQLFGSRAGNVLTKLTIILGVVFTINTCVLAVMYTSTDNASMMERATSEQPVNPTAPAPGELPGGAAVPAPDGAGVPGVAAPAAPAPAPIPIPAEPVSAPAPIPIPAEPAPANP